jgi:hypothetical protein
MERCDKIVQSLTYWNVKGLEKNKKEMMMETALRHVVTVAAVKAPHVFTRVRTICIPRYPDSEKISP